MNKRKISILSALSAAFVAILCALLYYVASYMVGYSLTPAFEKDPVKAGMKWEKRIPGIYSWYTALHNSGDFRDTVIVNRAGLRQHAVFCSAARPESAEGTAVLAHGYTDSHAGMLHIARMYRDSLNFNVLLFDQQFHGQSEGEAIQMGWFDRYNAAMWAEVAHDIWKDDFMVVHGISMGASTALFLSGGPDPECVKAYIADCGYSSVWGEFAHQLKDQFHLPAFPVLHLASMLCRHRYGWSFKEASVTQQLKSSYKPTFFIHGDRDTFVPLRCVYENYDAKPYGFKKIWICPGAKHADSYQKDPGEYTAQVRMFLSEVR